MVHRGHGGMRHSHIPQRLEVIPFGVTAVAQGLHALHTDVVRVPAGRAGGSANASNLRFECVVVEGKTNRPAKRATRSSTCGAMPPSQTGMDRRVGNGLRPASLTLCQLPS